MKKFVLVVLLLSCSTLLHAQTAKVVALTAEESKEARDIQAQRVALDKRDADLTERITKAYLQTTEPAQNNVVFGSMPHWRFGWEAGFVYSEDFKYIVPKLAQPTPCGANGIYWGGSTCVPSFFANPVAGSVTAVSQ